jgi:uncharacterized protein YggE
MAGAPGRYEAKSGIRLRVEPIDRLDAVASSLHLAGVSVCTVVLESGQSESARREAARLAMSNARAEAEAMAEAAGGGLGTLLRVMTLPDYAQNSRSGWSVYPGGPGPEGVYITPTDVTVIVTVQATWAYVAR